MLTTENWLKISSSYATVDKPAKNFILGLLIPATDLCKMVLQMGQYNQLYQEESLRSVVPPESLQLDAWPSFFLQK